MVFFFFLFLSRLHLECGVYTVYATVDMLDTMVLHIWVKMQRFRVLDECRLRTCEVLYRVIFCRFEFNTQARRSVRSDLEAITVLSICCPLILAGSSRDVSVNLLVSGQGSFGNMV